MRKLITLFLVFLLAFSTVASAEISIDLSTMSLQELVELHKLLDAEIDERISCEPSVFPAGIYVGGESIKPGMYIISANDVYYGINVATFQNIETYNQAYAENNEALVSYRIYLNKGDSTFVNIKEGEVLLVSDPALIEAATPAWAP